MELTLLILVTAIAGVEFYFVINLLRKVETYEDYIDSEIKNNETLLETLRRIDNKQMFEKDDEVGSLFDKIKQTIIRFKRFRDAA
jgi:hypothetical protein